jgi:hypothetical protein
MSKATKIAVTHSGSAERVPIEVIHRQAAAVAQVPLTSQLLKSVLNCVFIVNQQRQVVHVSRDAFDLLPDKQQRELLGLRLCEALDCVHARKSDGGCRKFAACRVCGAAKAMVSSFCGRRDLQEYRLTRFIGCRPEARDFLVMAAPLECGRETFSVVTVIESTDVRSRQALQRLFRQQAPQTG